MSVLFTLSSTVGAGQQATPHMDREAVGSHGGNTSRVL